MLVVLREELREEPGVHQRVAARHARTRSGRRSSSRTTSSTSTTTCRGTRTTIVDTIRREYDWELADDTTTTWRIGDGTAAFYNYIYQTIAGFTEDEVMLANMVREGHMTRDEALRARAEYGKPRWPSIREYAQLIGFSAEEALQIINAAPKLY